MGGIFLLDLPYANLDELFYIKNGMIYYLKVHDKPIGNKRLYIRIEFSYYDIF